MPYFIYTDLISSLHDPRLVDPGTTLVHTTLRSFRLLLKRHLLIDSNDRSLQCPFLTLV